jgi:hypothetical protein
VVNSICSENKINADLPKSPSPKIKMEEQNQSSIKKEIKKSRSTKLKKELMNLLGKSNDFPVELLLQKD